MIFLALRLSAMGDLLQSLPAIQSLASARPQDQVHLVVQEQFAPLLRGLDGFASVVEHDRRAGVLGYLATARKLRALRPDVAIDLQGNWKSVGLARLSGARTRIGAVGPLRQEPRSALWINRPVDYAPPRHPGRSAWAFAREIQPGLREQPLRLLASDEECRLEALALRALGIDPERPFRVLVLTDPADPRAWPVRSMQQQVECAETERSLPTLVLAGPAEAETVGPPGLPRMQHGAGELRRLVALGVLLARAGGVAYGPDQGASHGLFACGADVRFLFGPQDPAATAPLRATVLHHPDPPECMPCRARRCDHPDGPVCMGFAPMDSSLFEA